ncbi:S9 family peptidase [Halosimplex salinum]|uniref:S9 family peptidase n=1 Tax=Halosimplex salinum TaxID=1710538 RepID=UPI000F464D60|nr:S9 family peptidase [Halosimplex salinum]
MDELPTDALYDLVRPLSVAVSPDGDRVAVRTLAYDREADCRRSSVLTVPADGSRDPHRLARASDVSAMQWSPDGTRLGVVTARERDTELRVDDGAESDEGDDGDGSENGSDAASGDADPKPQVWVYDLERGGDARQVTAFDEGVREFDWGPDGERIVVSARDPTEEEQAYLDQRRDGGPIETERLQHKFDGQGWLDTVTTYLFVVDVATREQRRLDGAYGGGIPEQSSGLQPAWHPRDDRIAFVGYHGDDSDDSYVQNVHVVDAGTGETEQVTDGEYFAGGPVWSPDGARLAFLANNPTNWYVPTDVCVADADTGRYEVVTGELDRSVAWFEEFAWLDDDRLLLAIGDEGWSRFVRLDATGGHERVYDCQSRDESLMTFDTAGGTVAFVRQHPSDGVDAFGVAASDLDATADDPDPRRRLTELNPDLVADYDHPEIERVTFEGADGDAVEGVAFLPPDFDPADPDGDRPLLLSIHGGPRRYDGPHFDFDTAYWTTRGYVVFKVNYHGSTSYGRAFCERLSGSWGDVEVEDVLAGTDELVERGWVDPDRLFVTGFSFGGRSTANVLTETDRFAAGVAEHGAYDLRSSFGTDDSHRWTENEFGLPWENPEAYDAASSITDVGDIDTPLLLTAGEEDWRCPPTQSEQLHVSLKKRGVESKLVVYPDTHHVHYYVAAPGRATHRLTTLAEWYARFDPEREAGAE